MESILWVIDWYIDKVKCMKNVHCIDSVSTFPHAHECKTLRQDGRHCIEIMGFGVVYIVGMSKRGTKVAR